MDVKWYGAITVVFQGRVGSWIEGAGEGASMIGAAVGDQDGNALQ